jgi:hypothetical protein
MAMSTNQDLVARLSAELTRLQEVLSSIASTNSAMPKQRVEALITLDQAAAVVHRSKRTLQRYLTKMPDPRVPGGGGRPSLWAWSELRLWLQKTFLIDLPEEFPGRAF